jgi:hypothetical protein
MAADFGLGASEEDDIADQLKGASLCPQKVQFLHLDLT